MKALVTGAAGFVGSHVAENLIKRGIEVVGLDDLSGGKRTNVPCGVRLVEGSILDSAKLEKMFVDDRFDYVYHLAAYAAEGLSHFIRRFNYENNLVGSINLINQAVIHEVKSFVFTSSIAVYGRNQLPMIESLTPQPEDPYGVAKLAVELDLKAAHEMFGLNYVIHRPHNVYGERQNLADRYRNVIGIFMNRLLKGEPMTVFGDGSQQRAFSYVDDIAPFIAESGSRKDCQNEIFNVGSDEITTVKDLAAILEEISGLEGSVAHYPARNEVHQAYADHSKFKSYFPGGKSTSLREGLRKMFAWAKRQPIGPSSVFGAIEIERNLPSAWVV